MTTTNELLNLPPSADATARKEALQALTIEELIGVCERADYKDAPAAYSAFHQLMCPDGWDEPHTSKAIWGGRLIGYAHSPKDALQAVRDYFDALYPIDYVQMSVGRLAFRDGLWWAYYDGICVGNGIDPYSAALCLYEHRCELTAQGLIGPLFDAELEAAHA